MGTFDKKNKSMFRSKRFDYLNDYKKGMNGKYVYYGSYHVFQGSEKERHSLVLKMVLLDVILAALYIVGGCIPAGKIWNANYVVIPFGLEAVALFFLCWRTISLCFEPAKVKDYIYKKTVPWIPVVSIIFAVISGITVITSLIYTLFSSNGEKIPMCILYMVLTLLMGVISFLFSKYFKKYQWKPEFSTEVPEEASEEASEA